MHKFLFFNKTFYMPVQVSITMCRHAYSKSFCHWLWCFWNLHFYKLWWYRM